MKDYKEKHGRVNVHHKEDKILYNYCYLFARVDELKACKEKHGHLSMRRKEVERLSNFCYNVRRSRQGKGSYRLDDDRISALDAIGFEWEMGDGATAKSNDDRFFARVDDLKAWGPFTR